MKKKQLLNFLKKYNLSGQIESVSMEISDGIISTLFSLSDMSMTGKVVMKQADYTIYGQEDTSENHVTKIGIYNTSQLLKFVDVLDEDINFGIHKTNGKYEYISMIDENSTDIKYILSELSVIPVPRIIKEEKMPVFELDIELTTELIDTINKSRAALSDTRTFYFDVIKNKCFLILNDGKNKIKIEVTPTDESKLEDFSKTTRVLFPIDLFRTILNVSKDFETSRLQVSSEHLIKLQFDNEEFESEYYVLAQA